MSPKLLSHFAAHSAAARRRFLLGSVAAVLAGRFGDLAHASMPPQAFSGLASAPGLAAQAPVLPFYGINGHVNQGAAYSMPFAQQRALLEDLGLRIYRNDVWDAPGARRLAALCDALDPGGITVLPCLTAPMPTHGNEALAYQTGYALGHTCASTLQGRVPVYECGNELESTLVRGDGATPDSYDAVNWPAYRGLLRGMIDGVRRADPAARVGIHASWLHFGALSMLWSGASPSGLHDTPLRWDVTMYHWYSDMGDIRNAKSMDVLGTLQRAFGLPICLTELGFRPDGSEPHQASYLADNMLEQCLTVRERYNLQSAMVYELFDMSADNHYGLLDLSGRRKKPAYHALKRFIAAHPS